MISQIIHIFILYIFEKSNRFCLGSFISYFYLEKDAFNRLLKILYKQEIFQFLKLILLLLYQRLWFDLYVIELLLFMGCMAVWHLLLNLESKLTECRKLSLRRKTSLVRLLWFSFSFEHSLHYYCLKSRFKMVLFILNLSKINAFASAVK